MKKIFKVILVIMVCGLIINICKAKYIDMQENETYVSSTNSKVKIELTKEDEELLTDDGYVVSVQHVAYLHVDDAVYKGNYTLFVNNIFQKELWVNFYGYYDDNNTTGALHEYFLVKGKKIITQTGYLHNVIFIENNTFVKKTWWNIWGKKVLVLVVILFFIWVFKDVPKDLADKEFREELRKEYKDEISEGIKEAKNDLVYGLKNAFKDDTDNNKT